MNRKQIRGFAVACFAITASTLLLATEPAARDDPNSILLQYGEFLRSEAKEHRDFLQTYYTIILAGLGTIAAVFGALLTWLNWRTKKEIQAQINATFAGTVGQLVESQAKEFETFLKSTRNRIETQSKQLETQSKQLDRQEEVIRALAVFSMASYIFDHLRGIYEGSKEPQREYLFRKNERLSEIFAIWLSMAT